MFIDPKAPNQDFPLLKGKANECRHLTAVLLEVFAEAPKPDASSLWAAKVQLCLKLSASLEQDIDHCEGFGLSEPGAFQEKVDAFLCMYLDVAQMCLERGWLLFQITIKHHYLSHLGCQKRNPRKTWNLWWRGSDAKTEGFVS